MESTSIKLPSGGSIPLENKLILLVSEFFETVIAEGKVHVLKMRQIASLAIGTDINGRFLGEANKNPLSLDDFWSVLGQVQELELTAFSDTPINIDEDKLIHINEAETNLYEIYKDYYTERFLGYETSEDDFKLSLEDKPAVNSNAFKDPELGTYPLAKEDKLNLWKQNEAETEKWRRFYESKNKKV
jgi:hypothetical protein